RVRLMREARVRIVRVLVVALSASLLTLVLPAVAPNASRNVIGLNATEVASASAAPCSSDGTGCRVGSVGPAGGIIFYDAGSPQWWGRYLEAWPTQLTLAGTWGATTGSIYLSASSGENSDVLSLRRFAQRRAMQLGLGKASTQQMIANGSPLALALQNVQTSGVITNAGWFIPSKDELDILYNAWKLGQVSGGWGAVPVWTSTESEDSYAWYQLFQDGTQFTDANGVIPKYPTNKNVLTSPKHVGSDFKPAPMTVIPVRSFGQSIGGIGPSPSMTRFARSGTCATSGQNCKIGDLGPAGGIIVYDAGSQQSWGRFLEVAPKSCEQSNLPWASREVLSMLSANDRILGKAIGAGRTNTKRIVNFAAFLKKTLGGTQMFAAVHASMECNGFKDWFLPSKDELNEACRHLSHSRTGRQLTPAGQFDRGYYWTSSDYNGKTAWSQYFADCQQFDRVQTLRGNASGAQRPFLVRPMRAFG
ncbi:MAG: hypothetical protein ACKOYI_12500, partial [Actinomycetota bacterium]